MRFSPALLAFTDGDVWRPGIGDPTVIGWLTVFAYFACAVLCFSRARQAAIRSRGTERTFWSMLTVVLVLLGINKQLDLQTFLTLTGRRIAIAQGWYENRRPVQFIFVALVAVAAMAGFFLVLKLVREQSRELWLPLLGFLLLLGFIIIRAASFHHVDALLNLHFSGIRMNSVLELGSIGIIALGAQRCRSSAKSGELGISPKAAVP